VPGILSVIAGEGGQEASIDRWGWYLYEDGAYRELPGLERQRRILIDDRSTCTAWVANSEGMSEIAES
jgi:hypothetical protein